MCLFVLLGFFVKLDPAGKYTWAGLGNAAESITFVAGGESSRAEPSCVFSNNAQVVDVERGASD